MTTPDRLRGYLRHFAGKYPDAWQQFDDFRAARGKDLPDWPSWCWCPLAGAYAIVSGGGDERVPFQRVGDIGSLGALAAWRMTQGIYRFDSDLFAALWSTPLTKIPVEILYRLPEWCVYIEAPPNYKIDKHELLGWFTHLEYDAKTGRPELRFVFDLGQKGGVLSPFMLHLTAATLSECVELALAESGRQAELLFEEPPLPITITNEQVRETLTVGLEPIVSVILYLCTVAADVADLRGKREKPGNPAPRKTKRGLRTFPLDGPTTWLTGYRIGATLRLAGSSSSEPGEGTHASPRPHIRRAHWHTYLTGPRSKPQKPVLKWLPPVPVGAGEIVPTIRTVK